MRTLALLLASGLALSACSSITKGKEAPACKGTVRGPLAPELLGNTPNDLAPASPAALRAARKETP